MLEVLITCVIIGFLAAAAIPAFSVWYPNYRLKSAARLIFSDLQLAKLLAIRSNGEYAVVFDPASDRYQIVSGGADKDYQTPGDNVIEKDVSLSEEYGGDVIYGHGNATSPVGSTFGDGVTHTANTATFNSRGIGTAGYVYITNGRGKAYAVGTHSSGVIVLRRWNDSITDWE